MQTITYKCKNCSSNLKYDPASGNFDCEYCGSAFELHELDYILKNEREEEFQAQARLYNCPSCGAEIFTEQTTSATFCVYCHNPVVLSDRLSGDYLPDNVVPFKIPREQVEERLLAWCKKKRFIMSDFFSTAQMGKLTGVYFPFWVADGDADVSVRKTGTKVRVWRVGDIEYTETSTYKIVREGNVIFNDYIINALPQEHTYILEGVQPYSQKNAEPFTMAYLSGFMAEKRSLERTGAEPALEKAVRDFSAKLVDSTIFGYTSLRTESGAVTPKNSEWSYVLMPAWVLTYSYKGKEYYFALNGDSGKVAGSVPLSVKKLSLLMGCLAFGISALLIFLGILV